MRIFSRVSAAVLGLAVVPFAVGAAQHGRADRPDRARLDTTFAFDASGTVSLGAGDGDIIVRGWSRNEIRIVASVTRGELRFDAGSRRVTLEPSRGGDDSRFEVTVPEGTRVAARARSGDVTVTGTKGAVEVRTLGGDVRVDNAADRIEIATISGDIEGSALRGDIHIGTVSGDVRIAGFTGDLEAETVSGEIVLRGGTARFVRTHSTSGDLTYEGTVDASGRYELVTHSGDIRLAMPASAGAQISIATWNGAVESDFPITLMPGEHGIGVAQSKRFTFSVGNGAARVTAETFSGDITISARDAPRRP